MAFCARGAIAESACLATMKRASRRHGTTCMNTNDIPYDIRIASESVQKHYARMIANGIQPRAAEMFALQKPPGVKGTDRTLMQGRYNGEQFNQMPPDHARNLITLAKRAGINPSGKWYCAGLADKRGPADPMAWVDSVSDVRKVAQTRNLTVRGAVDHEGAEVPPPPSKPLSERLTREMMKVEKERNPTMKQGELREMVVAKYGRKRKVR